MNWHSQNITTLPSTLLILCCLVISLFVSGSVGITNDVYRKNITCIDHERDALLKFKGYFDSEYCRLLTSWGNFNTPDCCTWKGVSCSKSGHVIGLHLRGAFPQLCFYVDNPGFSPPLSELKHLKSLDLSSNYFYDMDIPSSITSLVNLAYLNLSGSSFSQTIPNELGNLTGLKSLDLSNNDGLSANSLNWLSRLTSLRILNLSGTDLSMAKDWFPVIKNLPLLEVLIMDSCKLPTPLPSSTFLQSPNLGIITLSGNNFSSSSSSFQWLFDTRNYTLLEESLKHLHMYDSNLQGPIPDAIGRLKFLSYLNLSENSLSKKIPDAIGRLESLSYLDLSWNSLSKNIPDAIGKLKSLTYLDLSGNSLSGTISDAIGKLDSLTCLDLSENSLSNTIPDVIGKLESLTYLDLSENSLSNTIPDVIGKLESLIYLDLSGNSLSSTIPNAIGNLKFLTYLRLEGNLLSGIIPEAITNLQSLSHMDLSYNSLSGPIPSTLGSSGALGTMLSLSFLDLSHNRLDGYIPSAIGDLHFLMQIDLSNNNLQGPIPSSIANLEYLEYLDLSRNKLSGDIPCKLGSTKFLSFANFSSNNLSGSIPKYLAYLRPYSFQGNPSYFRTDKIQGRCDKINVGLYVSIGLGFYTGFCAFCGTLMVKSSWRHAYFRFVDHIFDNIYVTIVVDFARLRKNFQV